MIKKVIYFILAGSLILVAISFASQNMQDVEVNYYNLLSIELPLYVVVTSFLFIGLFLGYIFSYFGRFRIKRQLRTAQKREKMLEKEIQHINEKRTVST